MLANAVVLIGVTVLLLAATTSFLAVHYKRIRDERDQLGSRVMFAANVFAQNAGAFTTESRQVLRANGFLIPEPQTNDRDRGERKKVKKV